MPDAETVMREITARVPAAVRRIPDGETGARGNWIFFQLQKFLQSPWFVPAAAANPAGDYQGMPQLRLADGVQAVDVAWPEPGYAEAYLSSYATFSRLRCDGVIRDGVRFQAEYPTPRACMSWLAADTDRAALQVSYERALFADLARFLEAVPAEDAAVQWDVAVEFAVLEMAPADARPRLIGHLARDLARCVERVPDLVPVGLHLCYGDYQHRHFTEPASLELQVRLFNEVSAAARRPVTFASFTVPQNQRDPAYFTPLAALQAGPETELYFSLVPYHPAGQEPGTTAAQISLIDAALARTKAGSRAWGVCTECGMGRAGRDEIPALLDLHRAIICPA